MKTHTIYILGFPNEKPPVVETTFTIVQKLIDLLEELGLTKDFLSTTAYFSVTELNDHILSDNDILEFSVNVNSFLSTNQSLGNTISINHQEIIL